MTPILSGAAEALAEATSLHTVSFWYGGARLLAALDVDLTEHQRRAALGAGAVTSTAALHALWLLPAGARVSTAVVPRTKLDGLLQTPGVAVEADGAVERTFVPAARVQAVAFTGSRIDRSIHRAARFTPIFDRYAIGPRSYQLRRQDSAIATEWSVGVLSSDPYDSIIPVGPRVTGVPSVFRWWFAELAYAAWLQERTHPVSCAFGSSGPCMPAMP